MMVAARSFYKSGHLHYLIRMLVQLYDVYEGTHNQVTLCHEHEVGLE